MRENLTLLHANNKAADQPAHPCSLISNFVIRYLERIEAELPPRKISIIWLVAVAEKTSSSLTRSDFLKTGFLVMRSIL